jgi:hypothetical protein
MGRGGCAPSPEPLPPRGEEMAKYTQTRDELLGHLKAQIAFMQKSASSYDNGFEDEAKRLAGVIRVLVHDTSQSTSLLSLLDKKNIKFYNSASSFNPRNIAPYISLTMMKLSPEGAFHVAPLDGGPPVRSRTDKISFRLWWEGMFVIKDKNSETFTRKGLVLSTANMDGGAHVDPHLDKAYANLSRFNSLGWQVFRNNVEDNFKNSPVSASLRQIAHEVIKTLRDGVTSLFAPNDSLFEIFRAYEEHCKKYTII